MCVITAADFQNQMREYPADAGVSDIAAFVVMAELRKRLEVIPVFPEAVCQFRRAAADCMKAGRLLREEQISENR